MAIKKDIVQPDSVTTSYHRILALTLTTNRQNSIEVLSYVDEDSRTTSGSYQAAATYELPYDDSMTTSGAYEYLKTLDVFEGGEDV